MPIDVFWQAGKLPAGVWVPDQGVSTYRAPLDSERARPASRLSALTSCAGSAARMTPPMTATPAAPAAISSATRAALMPPIASTGTRAARAISARVPCGRSRGHSPACSPSRRPGPPAHSRPTLDRSLSASVTVWMETPMSFAGRESARGRRIAAGGKMHTVGAGRAASVASPCNCQLCALLPCHRKSASAPAGLVHPPANPFRGR